MAAAKQVRKVNNGERELICQRGLPLTLCVLSAGNLKEVLDVLNLLRLQRVKNNNRLVTANNTNRAVRFVWFGVQHGAYAIEIAILFFQLRCRRCSTQYNIQSNMVAL
jgi:hypothetical protein